MEWAACTNFFSDMFNSLCLHKMKSLLVCYREKLSHGITVQTPPLTLFLRFGVYNRKFGAFIAAFNVIVYISERSYLLLLINLDRLI